MNRHHPYGGGFESGPPRRGGSPAGPGPDRSYRFQDRGGAPFRGRGGFGRGRGGYGGYEGTTNNASAYDQGHLPGEMGAYNDYEPQGAPQNSYYQASNYGSAPPAQFTAAAPSSAAYDQGYSKLEDDTGAGFDEDGFGRRRPVRKERDDKVHDSIIEERIQRERPCRTLFIRNIKYETNSDDVRRQFEEHGEIKTFFDLISTRGMVFVTYFDLRAAERARERLQGSEISGRPIDVHYSLPRDDQRGNDREKNQQFQGTLQVTLRNSTSGQPIDDNEVRRKFQQFGDVKAVKPYGDHIDSRYVEFYDTRACDEAFDRLRHQGLQDGVMDIVFAWDVNDTGHHGAQRESGSGHREYDDGGRGAGRGGGRGRGRGRGGRGRGHDDYDDRRGGNDYGRSEREPRGRGGRYDDDYGGRGGRGGNNGYNDRYENNTRGGYGGGGGGGGGSGGGGSAVGGGYVSGSSLPSGNYAPPQPPPVTATPPDDRLEQARKVQQLLAALKQPQGVAPPPPAAAAIQQGTPGMPPMSAMQQQPPLNTHSYYQPPTPMGYSNPPNTMYGMPPPSSTPQPPGSQASPNTALNGLPPNILALLQSAQQQQRPPPPAAPYGMPPPQGMMNSPPPLPGASNNLQYQQLMSFLQQGGGKQ